MSACANAVRVAPGQTVGNTSSAPNAFSFGDGSGCQGGFTQNETAGDALYVISVPNNQRLVATLALPDGGGSEFDSIFNLIDSLANCGTTNLDGGRPNGLTCAVGTDDPQPQTVRFDNTSGSDRDVFLLVDGYDTTDVGVFGLNVSLTTLPNFVAGGETCAMPTVIPPTGTVLSSTDGGVSSFAFASAGQCRATNVATDRTYSITVPPVSRATVDVTPEASFDAVVNVVEGALNCGSLGPDGGTLGASCVVGSSVFGTGAFERVVMNNLAPSPTTYTIIVDSNSSTASARAGSFEITSSISALPPRLQGGETCAAPIALTPGSITGSTAGTANDFAFSAVGGCRASGTAGDVVYSINVPAAHRAQLTTTSLTAGYSPSVNVIEGAANCGTFGADGGTLGSACVANNSSAGSFSVSNLSASPTTYLVAVDSTTFASPAVGGYQLDYAVNPIPAGDVCATAELITASGTLTGTTVGFGSDVAGLTSCTGFSSGGTDRVYEISVGPGQTVTALVTPTTAFDPAVYFVAAPASNCLASDSVCVGTGGDTNGNGTGAGSAETGTFTNSTASARTVFIVVDAWSGGGAGAYSLSINLQ